MVYKLLIEKKALKRLKNLKRERKIYAQLVEKIFSLLKNPYPQDVKRIRGYKEEFLRVDSGEYRIVYRVSEEEKTIYVILIEKRNDDEVYKILKNL